MEKRPIAYQVYSAREAAEKDLRAVFAELARLGYDGVEFAGFYGNSAEEIRAMLDEAGLRAISSHVALQLIEADMFGVIAYHQAIGCEYIAVPYLDDATRPGAPGFAHALSVIARFGRLCREAGITLLYHNHDFEFVKVSGQYGLDFIYDAIPACALQTEIDTCWVKFAGLDPAAYIRQYAGRCPVVHLKDFVGGGEGGTPYALLGIDEKEKGAPDKEAFAFRPVGHGCQDVAAIVTAGIESGAKWFVVEQDMSTDTTPLEDAARSIETLRRIGLK